MKTVLFEFNVKGQIEVEDDSNVDDLLVAFPRELKEASYIDSRGAIYVTSAVLITPELKGGKNAEKY